MEGEGDTGGVAKARLGIEVICFLDLDVATRHL